jgi:hypothetical protein
MGDIAFLVGALVPTLFLSRLAAWLLRNRLGNGYGLALVANAASLSACLGILSMTDNVDNFWAYVLAQIIWLAMDLFRAKRGAEPIV